MKIAWFTPFVKASAIGKVSAQICEELSRHHAVEIWTQHKEDLQETSVPVRSFGAGVTAEELSGYDAVIYNLGNYTTFHREIYEISQKVSGVVILHDQTMSYFWGQYFCTGQFSNNSEAGFQKYRELLRQYYGEKAAEGAVITDWGGLPAHETLSGYSYIEPSISNAAGIFTHSGEFAKRLQEISNTPIAFSYLPCRVMAKKGSRNATSLTEILSVARKDGRKIIVSTGIVHPIKRIDKVVEILMEEPELAKKICYVVIGEYGGEYGEWLKALSDNALKGCLYMLGYMSDEAMEEALQEADLAINLRYPNSEVCSLSLWEQMAAGKPVVVLDEGIYGEVPAETVIRIHRQAEHTELKNVLWELANEKLDLLTGKRAQQFISQRCSVSEYCRRLVAFLEELEGVAALSTLQNQILQYTGRALAGQMLTEQITPASYAVIIEKAAQVLGEIVSPISKKILGVWIGFPYYIPNLSREGISRLMGFLVSSLLEYYPDVTAEVWSYSFNLEEVERIFSSVRQMDRGRLQLITEKNWADVLEVSAAQRQAVGEISEIQDNLVRAVRAASKASVFVPIILYLDRIAEAGKRLFVPGYDMAVAEHYGDFIKKDPLYMAHNLNYIWRAENFAAHGADFFCNSDLARQTEILKYIRNLEERRSHVIYIPPNIPEGLEEKVLEEGDLRARFNLTGRYLFYPTQIRPYKNVATLVRAFAALKGEYDDLKLVLTGEPEDVPEVQEALSSTGAHSRTVILQNVSEAELYSLYRYAAAVPVTSVFEGGFHYQAMEGLLMGAPVAVANVPVVRERIAALGYSAEDCGLPLFTPEDGAELAAVLRELLADRAGAAARQRAFGEKLLGYTWKEAAAQYHSLFFGEGSGQ